MTRPNQSRPPGGAQRDYLAAQQYWQHRRTHHSDNDVFFDLDDYVCHWVNSRMHALNQIEQGSLGSDEHTLEGLAFDSLARINFECVGHSPAAWMERSVTSTAMLLDHRSRQFGRKLRTADNRARHWARDAIEFLEDSQGLVAPEPVVRPVDGVEFTQLVAAATFHLEWQQYLTLLLARTPGPPPSEWEPFPTSYNAPDWEVGWQLAQMGHCRPAGAMFSYMMEDWWLSLGGRETCRALQACPHCHARNATRLVERVQQGPWRRGRQKGRQLVLLRVAVPTPMLRLDPVQQDEERERLGFHEWLRTSRPHYTADIGAATKIRNIQTNQSMSDTLAPCEIRAASRIRKELLGRARTAGIDGGLWFHSIGPSRRQYLHELCVVGEVPTRSVNRLCRDFGIPNGRFEIAGCPVECTVVPREYRHAARLLLAGSSWRYDLDRIGAICNEEAYRRSHSMPAGISTVKSSVGLRGALAWQPLFLLSSVAFWSRLRVLRATSFKSAASFGTWKGQLRSNRKHRSAVQRRRWAKNGGPIKEGHARNPTMVLQRRISRLAVSQAALAREAGCSRSAISRFVNDGHGGSDFIEKLRSALPKLEASAKLQQPKPTLNREAISSWLKQKRRTQSWLGQQTGFSSSQVSRYLNGKSDLSSEFALAVEKIAEGDCIMFTSEVSTQPETAIDLVAA